MQCHQGATNLETSSKVLFLKYADPSKLGRTLLEGSTDHLLSQTRSKLMKQENQVGSFNSCINEVQQQAYVTLKDWNCRTPVMDIFNLEENKHVHKKN